jgi:hypothetical protein
MMATRSLCLIVLATLFVASANAQQQTAIDPKNLLVLSEQVGGGAAINTVKDFVAHGTITRFQASGETSTGQATIRGRGDDQFRMDYSSGSESLSWDVNHGNGEYKSSNRKATAKLPSYNSMNDGWLTLPYMRLATVLRDSGAEVKYVGFEASGSNSFQHIKVVRHLSKDADPKDLLSGMRTTDYYLNPSDSEIIAIVDLLHPDRRGIGMNSQGQVVTRNIQRSFFYSDFRSINGVLVPFSVTEFLAHQRIWALQLTDINFNTGQQDADFQLQ